MSTAADPATKAMNDACLDKLTSSDSTMQKEASDAINDYTRMKMREDGFWRRILPPVAMTNDQLDRQVDTDKPVKVIDKEPDSPGAISLPFASLPMNRYVKAPRYRVMFFRIVTPKFTKDVDELRTYDMDVRQILSDNSIKDMLAEEDGTAIATINTLLGAAGSTVLETGAVQYRQIHGGITRDTLMEGMKTMPRTNKRLNPATGLVNNVTIWDIAKFGRDEVGGDLAQEMFRTGFTERELLGIRWIITIKRDLVHDGHVFMFAEPKFLGKFYTLEDTVMYIDRRAYMLEWFAYESIGSSVANVAAVVHIEFIP